jgi:ABC-type multidrug transport system fused ATPase/permease subunit
MAEDRLVPAYMRRDADILILDEPTSALDPAAEAAVFEHFSQHSEGRMTLLISHRFSSVRNADQIIVLEAGRILEQGGHDSLIAANGRYASCSICRLAAIVRILCCGPLPGRPRAARV